MQPSRRERYPPSSRGFNLLLCFVIALGILLRLIPYLANRSLWRDEAALAWNVMSWSFSLPNQPPEYTLAAPIGFVVLQKYAIQFLGNTEYALRFIPLLAGIAAVFLFLHVATRVATPMVVAVGLIAFSVSAPLIYYSSEAKQHSVEVAVALLLTSLALHLDRRTVPLRPVLLLGLIGASAIWISHSAVFILVGIGMGLASSCLDRKNWAGLGRLSFAGSLWLVSFAVLFVVSLKSIASNETLLSFWDRSFAPFPPISSGDARWYFHAFFGMFDNPAGFSQSAIAAFAFLVGGVHLFRRQRDVSIMLVTPILAAMLASGLHRYPFSGRLLLFFVPAILLLICEGVGQVWEHTRERAAVLGVLFIGCLFIHPAAYVATNLLNPREDIKLALSYLRSEWRDGDLVYVQRYSQPAFRYYKERFGFRDYEVVMGSDGSKDWRQYERDLGKLAGKDRVWFLFSYVIWGQERDGNTRFSCLLDKRGRELASFQAPQVAVYLYDLREPPASLTRSMNAEGDWADARPHKALKLSSAADPRVSGCVR